jgi:hypothetical protein
MNSAGGSMKQSRETPTMLNHIPWHLTESQSKLCMVLAWYMEKIKRNICTDDNVNNTVLLNFIFHTELFTPILTGTLL